MSQGRRGGGSGGRAKGSRSGGAADTATGPRRRRVLVALPQRGFDPTEAAVPVRCLLDAGVDVEFCTPAGGEAACDPIMITGRGLYLLKWSMRADAHGRHAYKQLEAGGALAATKTYADAFGAGTGAYDGLLLPGGHCPDMRPYLEDAALRAFAAAFVASGKPVAAVCHGVVVLARAGVLRGRRVTALPSWMETTAHTLTRAWMGDYYKTYPGTSVEAEVTEALGPDGAFAPGPLGFARDAPGALAAGFVVEDGNLLTARWPGDTHALGAAFVAKLSRA